MINKSLYKLYLRCPEDAWLAQNKPSAAAMPLSDEERFKLEQGNLVDIFAQELCADKKWLKALDLYQREIHFQYRVQADGFVAIADIIALDSVTKSIDLLEVKASRDYDKVVGEYTDDAAFQCQVFERAGFMIRKVYILYIDPTFVYEGGKIKASDFFRHPNISEVVHKQLPKVKQKCDELKTFLSGEEPKKSFHCCKAKLDCTFFQYHYGEKIPDYSIFDISRITHKSIVQLLEKNVLDIQDVPKDFKLSASQRTQVDVAQSNLVQINQKAIDDELKKLVYPLYFLDYETINLVFPMRAGFKPYAQMVFQYSLHILENPNGELRHAEYLLTDKNEDVANLLAHLQQNIGEKGSIIVWNESFEKSRNKEMAELYPAFAYFLHDVNERIYDLMQPFQKGHYIHPDFQGSYSIKSVLPVLLPTLTYENLKVQNGTQAVFAWHQAVNETDDEVKNQTFDALRAYCHLDTLAMVEILKSLLNC